MDDPRKSIIRIMLGFGADPYMAYDICKRIPVTPQQVAKLLLSLVRAKRVIITGSTHHRSIYRNHDFPALMAELSDAPPEPIAPSEPSSEHPLLSLFRPPQAPATSGRIVYNEKHNPDHGIRVAMPRMASVLDQAC